jgi:phosphohistidine swiveling domain-containing protein
MAHRAVLDYELAEPRYGENPSAFRPIPEITSTASAQRVDVDTGRLSKRLRGPVDVVRRFQALKEDAKHYSLRELAVLRRVVLTLDRRLGLNGLSFFLSFDELLSLRERPMADLRETAEGRRHQRARFLAMAPLAPTLTVRELETISAGGDAAHRDSEGVIRGTRVAGSDDAEGRARVIADEDAERGRPIPDFQDGDIIVATMVHPAWLPYFRRAGGFVCQVGGWLSHTAILAREYDVPLIVNTHGMSAITDGSILRLRSDGTVEMLERERALDQIAA